MLRASILDSAAGGPGLAGASRAASPRLVQVRVGRRARNTTLPANASAFSQCPTSSLPRKHQELSLLRERMEGIRGGGFKSCMGSVPSGSCSKWV